MRPTPGSVRRNTLRTPRTIQPDPVASRNQRRPAACPDRPVFRFSVPRITFPGESYRYASGRAAGGRRRIGAGDFTHITVIHVNANGALCFLIGPENHAYGFRSGRSVLPLDNLDAAGTNFTDLVLGINDRTHGQKANRSNSFFILYKFEVGFTVIDRAAFCSFRDNKKTWTNLISTREALDSPCSKIQSCPR